MNWKLTGKKLNKKDMKSIILLSGGLDSVVSLELLKEKYNISMALTFDYGQKAAVKETEASKKLADYYKIFHSIIKLEWLEEITTTSLVNDQLDTPNLNDKELDDFNTASESAKKVWVPNRNGLFLNIAASYSDSYNFTHIIFGANKEEGTTFPDNTQDFIDRVNEAFKYSTLTKPEVAAPLINFTKQEIVKLGFENNVPFNLIRSCYHSEEKHCGICESCKRLKRALKEVGYSEIIAVLF